MYLPLAFSAPSYVIGATVPSDHRNGQSKEIPKRHLEGMAARRAHWEKCLEVRSVQENF